MKIIAVIHAAMMQWQKCKTAKPSAFEATCMLIMFTVFNGMSLAAIFRPQWFTYLSFRDRNASQLLVALLVLAPLSWIFPTERIVRTAELVQESGGFAWKYRHVFAGAFVIFTIGFFVFAVSTTRPR